jgi:type II secretory pathway component GspD/PulD (secretin)
MFVAGLAILVGWASTSRAQPEVVAAKAAPPVKARDAKAEEKKPEKTYAFSMDGQPWADVFKWLADQTGKPVIAPFKPTGTLTLHNPTGKKYTMPEVIDIINDGLLANSVTQKYYMINRERNFTVVPADEKIDGALLPRITVDELDSRGRTELVSMTLQLKTLVAEDFGPEAKKLLGPFGEVVVISSANQLIVQDNVGNLKRLVKTVQAIEKADADKGGSLSHKCVWIKAGEAARILKELLPDIRDIVARATVAATGGDTRGGPGGPGGPGGFGGPGGGGRPVIQVSKMRMHYITSDERTNTVLVTGPADKVAAAEAILKRIDVEQKGQKPILVGPPSLKIYSVKEGTAESIAKTLQEVYKASPTCRISTAGATRVLVYATPEDQEDIARQILTAGEKAGSKTQTFAVGDLDASTVAEMLQAMFGETKGGAPVIKALTDRNVIVARGTEEQIDEVKQALEATIGMPKGGGADASRIRSVTLEGGNATLLAEEIARVLKQMRKNPVEVISPGGGDAPKEDKKDKLPPPKKVDRESRRMVPGGARVARVSFYQDPGIVDPRDKKDTRPGSKEKPIRIYSVGNRLLITGDDPEAMALIQQLIALYTDKRNKGDFEVIKLRNANAVEAATALDQVFNGTRPATSTPVGGNPFGGGRGRGGFLGGGPGGFFNPFAAPGASTPTNPQEDRIRVVAYPSTNSILVRANPLDKLAIRDLLAKALDTEDTDSRALIKTHLTGPLKYASATDVAAILKDVYREQINPATAASTTGRGSVFASVMLANAPRQTDALGNPKTVALSIGVDERTNQLVLACSDAMYKDIKNLVEALDNSAKMAERTVQVVSIKGLDPLLVQTAIDAIQGRTTMPRTGSTMPGGTSAPGGVPFGINTPLGGRNFGAPGGGPGGGFGGPGMGGPGRGPGGGGFGPGGGGFAPGGGGGGRGGGGPGGGRGGGGRGGMGDLRQPGQGPDFFDWGVMDDPKSNLLYDPQLAHHSTAVHAEVSEVPGHAAGASALPKASHYPDTRLLQVRFAAAPLVPPPLVVGPEGTLSAPRSTVLTYALPETGQLVIIANSQADLNAVLNIIRFLELSAAGSDLDIQMVPLKNADATATAAYLTEFYRRVVVGPSGTTRSNVPGVTTQAVPFAGVVTQQALSSVILLAYPRFNAILTAAPKARMEEILARIKDLDKPNVPAAGTTSFQLKKVSVSQVGQALNAFWAARYPGETANQIRVTWDVTSNTLFVQAAPNDLAEIRALVEELDKLESKAVNEIRVVPLRNALADELATLITQAIQQSVSVSTPGVTPGLPGALPGGQPIAPVVPPAAFPGAVPGGLAGATALPSAASGAGITTRSILGTKYTSLRFIGIALKGKIAQTGWLDDIRLTPYYRTNSIIVSAPAQAVDLLVSLIGELDIPPAARAEINIFPLKKADAATLAATIQQLFLGSSSLPTGTTGAPGGLPGGVPGLPGPGAFPGTAGALGGGANAGRPLVLTIAGQVPEGAPLIDLRITIDQRTNSLIVAGGRNDLEVVEAIVTRLEDAEIQQRHNCVYRLVNSTAVDVANALNTFITNLLQVYQRANQLPPFQDYEREVVVVPEPITNKLLISATPRYYPDVMRMISELDAELPQVVIQVLIAEVDLDNTEEFGVEIGLQSPVLFNRSLFGQGGTTTYTANTTAPSATTPTTVVGNFPSVGTTPIGVSATATNNPATVLGFNFNQPFLGLGNNPIIQPGVVGYQGVTSLGVGRTSPNIAGVSGFVFSASNDVFNLLIRALKAQ